MVELAQHIMSCLLGLSVSAGFIAPILKAHRLYKWPSREEELHHTHKVSIPRFGGIALAVAFVSVIWLFRIESNPHSTDGVASPPKAPEGWRTPRRFALPGVAGIRASVLDCGGPPSLFPNRHLHAASPLASEPAP
jgi:UDP-N-acetylmuramyl pentapeptide phosphotransferase/UDP-N-acetylglucosamine-1-phosphate transferase